MSTDELLVLVPYAEVEAKLAAMTNALSGTHALAVNVSDARAVFRVSGPVAREVLGKLAPVDLSSRGIPARPNPPVTPGAGGRSVLDGRY